MLVGFVAVIVVLLIITAIMSSGMTTTTGGVDSAKSTEILTEVSELGKAIQHYPATSINSNYTGLSITTLNEIGIGKGIDIYTIDGTEHFSLICPVGTKVVKSKALDGVFYYITEATPSTFSIVVFEDTAKYPFGSSVAISIENSMKKLYKSANIIDTIPNNGVIQLNYLN